MPASTKHIEFAGDKKIKARLKRLLNADQRVKGYDVGFFKSATYNDGLPVAIVAFYNEFGIDVPERPFFRQANKKAERVLVKLIKHFLTLADSYVLTVSDIDLIAQKHAAEIQQSITDLKEPPNSPITTKRKKSSNPLIDTGIMRRSVTSKVIK